jgi:hypothetical protein
MKIRLMRAEFHADRRTDKRSVVDYDPGSWNFET